MHDSKVTEAKKVEAAQKVAEAEARGRFPANLIHDGSPEVLEGFPEAGGNDKRPSQGGRRPGGFGAVGADSGDGKPCGPLHADSGSAARFFYCAKASKADRGHLPAEELPLFGESVPEFVNDHPTVKPLTLMKYLLTLVAMPTDMGLVDPFAGSGTTLVAAKMLGRRAIGIELAESYCEIAAERLRQGVLF